MADGSGTPYMGYDSLVGIAEETTFGTFVTSTSDLEFNTEAMKMVREELKIEAINSSRDFRKRLIGNESVDGSLEMPFNAASDAICYLIKQACGGTATADTQGAAGTSVLHTFGLGNMESNKGTSSSSDVKGLSISVRRGLAEATNNTFNYYGCRVGTLTLKAEIGQPVIMSVEVMGKGMSLTSTLPAAGISTVLPLHFTGVAITTGVTISAVSTSECFTMFEFTLNNNNDGDQRCLGGRQRTIIPPVKRDVTLKLGQRFDTVTAFKRFEENTATAIRILCTSGDTISAIAGDTTYSMIIDLPACYVNSNQPEVGGADVLTHELEITPMWQTDPGYVCQIKVRNATANYY